MAYKIKHKNLIFNTYNILLKDELDKKREKETKKKSQE